MKKVSLFIFFLVTTFSALASHIVGGEMIYEYLKAGATPGTNQYRITLRLFRDQLCPPPCAEMPAEVFIGIYDNGTGRQVPAPSGPAYFRVTKNGGESRVEVGNGPDCVVNPPELNYNVAEYSFTVDLPENAAGYTAAYQTCCRVNPMTNVFNTGRVGDGTGSTYTCTIPGTSAVGAGGNNNSAQFKTTLSPICAGKPFKLDFSVTDKDNDQIEYVFCDAFGGGSATSSTNINPSPPPYNSVPYISGYSGSTPLGDQVRIDPKSGVIQGIAPQVGRYVVSVCAYEYRGGKLINIHRKDFLVNVANCDFAGAQLDPTYTFCESLTASFQNQNNSPLNKTYFWDFGDGATSTEKAPTHTYKDTGTYEIKLIVNKGEPCGDSMSAVVRMYPFFKADFSFAGGCVGKPTIFTDRTINTYGTVAEWNWSFGNNDPANRSTIRNPTFTFTTIGQKQVQLIATSTKGCKDTALKVVDITDKPTMDLRFRDTLICKGDRLQLEARGIGNFSWTPGIAIQNPNTATPTVSPVTNTSYVVKLDQDGCINFDTVRVRVVDIVTLVGNNDTTICATDSIRLGAFTDGLRFQWTPTAGLSNPAILNPMAAPATSTTYRLNATIGGCTASDDIKVTVVPYPVASAGNDALICYESTVQLKGGIVGSQFSWAPANLLQDPSSLNPTTRSLQRSQAFVLTVFDNKGCPKPGRDTVIVEVLPNLNPSAGRDTAVVVGQPLQLQATGGVDYQWTPPIGLNNPNIANPIATYDGSVEKVRYSVLVANEAGCIDSAAVTVRIFKTNATIFVPTAFTPNGDNNNDIFRPIAVGMSRIQYFQVFNRWGQLVFQTTEYGRGWDGRVNGQLQGTGTYAWMVKGIDYEGKPFTAKGTVTLIR